MTLKPISEVDGEHEAIVIAMTKALIDNGAEINTKYYLNKNTLFHFAWKKHYFELFKVLCTYPQAGEAINELDESTTGVLGMILTDRTIDNNQRYEFIKMAIDAGANPKIAEYCFRRILTLLDFDPEQGYGPYEPRLIELLKSYAH